MRYFSRIKRIRTYIAKTAAKRSDGNYVEGKGVEGTTMEATGVAYLHAPTPSSARRRDRRLEYRLTTVSAGFRFSFPPTSRPRNYFRDSSIVHVSRSAPPRARRAFSPLVLPTPSDIPALLSPLPQASCCSSHSPLHLFTYARRYRACSQAVQIVTSIS